MYFQGFGRRGRIGKGRLVVSYPPICLGSLHWVIIVRSYTFHIYLVHTKLFLSKCSQGEKVL
jgi:hypothetical protein